MNIGPRQDGRLRADNVIDVAHESTAIEAALRQALFDDEFRATCRSVDDSYDNGSSGSRIADVLAQTALGPHLVAKRCTMKGREQNGWYQ